MERERAKEESSSSSSVDPHDYSAQFAGDAQFVPPRALPLPVPLPSSLPPAAPLSTIHTDSLSAAHRQRRSFDTSAHPHLLPFHRPSLPSAHSPRHAHLHRMAPRHCLSLHPLLSAPSAVSREALLLSVCAASLRSAPLAIILLTSKKGRHDDGIVNTFRIYASQSYLNSLTTSPPLAHSDSPSTQLHPLPSSHHRRPATPLFPLRSRTHPSITSLLSPSCV